MNAVLARSRSRGGLMLSVLLLLGILAALSIGLNRAAGMDAQAVSSDYDSRNAAYMARAAVAAAKWMNQTTRCTSKGFSNLAFANGTLTASIDKAGGKAITVNASATTAAGGTASLSVKDLRVVDFSKSETKDLGGGVLDMTIDRNTATSQNDDDKLALVSNQSHGLLFWPMADIPPDSEVLAAQLFLTQAGASATARTVTVHRVTTRWDGTATWTRARGGAAWNGGDYTAPETASAEVKGAGVYTWDMTGMVEGWTNARMQDFGVLLRLPKAGQSVSFYSKEAALSSLRPVLRVSFAKPC